MENSGNEHDVVHHPVLNRVATTPEANRKFSCAMIGDYRSAFGIFVQRQNSLPDGLRSPDLRLGISFEKERFEPLEIVFGKRQ